jgi:hypothetical protein
MIAAEPKAIFVTAFVLGALLIGILRFAGYDAFYAVPSQTRIGWLSNLLGMKRASWIAEANEDRICIAKAKALDRPYVLRSVVELIQYYRDPHRASYRGAHRRFIYDVLALKEDTAGDPSAIFEEEIAPTGGLPQPWYGPRVEHHSKDTPAYKVEYSVRDGESFVIATGLDEIYPPNSFSVERKAVDDMVPIAKDEAFFDLENPDDVICRATLLVESNDFFLEQGSALRVARSPGGPSIQLPGEGTPLFQRDLPEEANSALQYTWNDVQPEQTVGILLKVTPKR